MEDDDYPWDVGRSDPERAFLARLRELSNRRALFDAWTFYPQLVVTLTISDPEHKAVLRTLRVDFDGVVLRGGNDPSHQIDPSMDRADPDYFERPVESSDAQSAKYAFDWFRQQSSRPIDRLEWADEESTWLRWNIAEVSETPLVASGLKPPNRAPDRVVRLDTRTL